MKLKAETQLTPSLCQVNIAQWQSVSAEMHKFSKSNINNTIFSYQVQVLQFTAECQLLNNYSIITDIKLEMEQVAQVLKYKQAKWLKSCERRPEVNGLNG